MMLVTALEPTPIAIAIAGNANNNRNPHNKEIQIPFHSTRQKNKGFKAPSFKASMIYDPDDFQVGKFIGSYGFMNVTSYSSFQSGGGGGLSTIGRFEESYLGDSSGDIEQLRVQEVGEGNVKISFNIGFMKAE